MDNTEDLREDVNIKAVRVTQGFNVKKTLTRNTNASEVQRPGVRGQYKK